MEPSDYDKIADKLMQFRNRLPRDNLSSRKARVITSELRSMIMDLLEAIDIYAGYDEDGWIR
ncbi:MAG: hypothetical protein ACXADW_24150 [Candidatus Hodarchaeales archaeon]|jgi:hypothetical protein